MKFKRRPENSPERLDELQYLLYNLYIQNINKENFVEEPKTNLIIRIPVALKMQLESCAADADLTASQVVRSLIREYVKKNYSGDLFAQEKKKRRAAKK